MIKQEEIKIIKLIASDGMTLTDGEVYGKEVYLGKNDSSENWNEITDKEYDEILKRQKETTVEAKNEDMY